MKEYIVKFTQMILKVYDLEEEIIKMKYKIHQKIIIHLIIIIQNY